MKQNKLPEKPRSNTPREKNQNKIPSMSSSSSHNYFPTSEVTGYVEETTNPLI